MGTNDDRIKELDKQIGDLQNERFLLYHRQRVDFYKTKIGKYFRELFDTSDGFIRYAKVEDIDSFGNLIGFYFDVHDHGMFLSDSKVCLGGGIISFDFDYGDADEITEDKFWIAYNTRKAKVELI